MAEVWRMPNHMKSVINIYKTLTKIPNVLEAKLDKAGTKITSKWSIRNIDRGSNTHFMKEFILDPQYKVINKTTFGVDVSHQLFSSESPQGNFKAVIYEDKSGKDKKTFLEVWSEETLVHSIDLTSLDIHGNVYGDSEFGSLEWSADEKWLVYVAEKKPEKSEPFIKRKPVKEDGDVDTDKKIIPGREHLYKKDWGEQLTGKVQTVIVMCEVETEKISVLQGLPETWCPGQVCFSPSGESIIGVAWDTVKYRLGLIYCTNRHSYIFSLNIKNGNCKKLSTADDLAVRSPRIGPLGDLVWLERRADGPHHACHRLMWLPSSIVNNIKNADDNEIKDSLKTVIDIVPRSRQISDGNVFYGIYCQSLPKYCFSKDGSRLVFSTQQRNEVRSYVVNLATCDIMEISYNVSQSKNMVNKSTTVTCTRDDVLLAVCSSLTCPSQIMVGKLESMGVHWNTVWGPDLGEARGIEQSTVQYLEHTHTDVDDDINTFTSIYFAPNGDKDLPLVVWPHGGPHSAFSNVYSLEAAFFNMIGFAVIRVNYRGTTGAGDSHVRCLLGHVGQYDVNDCLLALKDVKERVRRFEHILLFGGSFGGFTCAHLAGRYNNIFKAMVLKNPLIDMVSKENAADNPDGCSVEAGMEYNEYGPVTEEQLLALRRCSPIVHVHQVKARTSLHLGLNDKRVPAFQGLEFANRLRANGVPTRVLMYEDNHTLSRLPVEMDSLINAADWFIDSIKPAQ